MIAIEALRSQLNAVQTHENMSTEELEQASSEINKIICTALNEIEHTVDNSNIIREWLEEYLEIRKNKSGFERCGTNLSHANLSHANLRHVYLGFTNLSRANLSCTNLSHANLGFDNLSHANLRHADLSHANLREANLGHASLSEANLSHASLNSANLSHAILRNANLSHIYLGFTNLSHANLSDANLSRANLCFTNLSFANLSFANLSHANLRNVTLNGAVVIGTDFTSARDGHAVMTESELEAKLADAIKTPDELLEVIQYFLDDSVQNALSKKDLDMLPSLYEAAVDIGNNGAKNRKDESVICQPGDEICQGLRKSARLLSEKFPILTVTSMEQLQTKAKSMLDPSVVIAIAKFLKGFSPRDNGKVVIAKDVAAKIVSERLSNTTDKATEPDGLSKKIANDLVGMVWGGSLSIKQVIAPGNLLSEHEKSLKPVEQMLSEIAKKEEVIATLKQRIVAAFSEPQDLPERGAISKVIQTTIGGKTHSRVSVKQALKELLREKKEGLAGVSFTRSYKTSETSKEIRHENHIQITMPVSKVAKLQGQTLSEVSQEAGGVSNSGFTCTATSPDAPAPQVATCQAPTLTTTTLVSANAPPVPAPVKVGAPVRHILPGQQRDF